MKYALGFLFCAVFGAAGALLFAPSSGEELRSNIRNQADTQYTRLQDEYQKGMQEMRNRMDKLRSDLDRQTEAVGAKAEEVSE